MSTEIHPTAIIDCSATIGDGVRIGPYCIIGKHVEIGDGCWLQHHVTVEGPTQIGPDNRFFAYGSIGQQTQDLKYQGEPTYLKIGKGNTFREFVTVNRATAPGSATTIGDHGNFLAYTHIAHDCEVGDYVIFSNNATLGGHVKVGDHAIIGGLTAVHQFCRIGEHAMTGGCCKIVQDIPPFFLADGNPARVRAINQVGLQRRGFPEETVRALKTAFRKLYRENLNVSVALAALEDIDDPKGAVRILAEFVATTDRGIH
ncbi:MAG: acyl-ACP--UDP-N-acetylglucosamine O-acyltransferase [Verrucomicrobiales bacterium]|nr:acyl-ACP--UDP-N-acetylglucosamine O-acyltransferase [Verrucomicrobiales bacterium]